MHFFPFNLEILKTLGAMQKSKIKNIVTSLLSTIFHTLAWSTASRQDGETERALRRPKQSTFLKIPLATSSTTSIDV